MKKTLYLLISLFLLLACSLPLATGTQPDDADPISPEQSSLPEGGEILPGLAAEPTPPLWQAPAQVPASSTALNVPLRVVNPFSDRSVRAPVTAGLPLPQGITVSNPNRLLLVDENGNPVPAQFTPLARWAAAVDTTEAPIRWLLLDFEISLAPAEISYLFLQEGSPPPVDTQINITEEADALWVDTTAARFRIDKINGQLSQSNQTWHLSGIALDADGQEYTASSLKSIQVVLPGARRTSIEVRGSYTHAGHTLLDYTARYWFYAGSSLVRLFYTVENNTLCPLGEYEQLTCHDIGSPGSVTFDDLSLHLVSGLNADLRYHTAAENPLEGALVAPLLLYQDSSGTPGWDAYQGWQDWEGHSLDTTPRLQAYVSYPGYQISMNDGLLASGAQAGGWLSLSQGTQSWGAGVRGFWQNYPKALRASPNGVLEIGLFPAEFGAPGYDFNLRAGEHKTHEIWLAPQPDLSTLLSPLFAQAPPQWYLDSGAIGLSALPDWISWPEHERYIADQLDTSPEHQGWEHVYANLFDAIESTGFYGIFDYGDWPIDYEGYHLAPLNPKYDHDYGMWLQWMRGADPRWFGLAEAADRHFADIDILHNLHQPRHWADGIIFGHSYHDEDGFLNPHRNYGGGSPDTAYGLRGLLLTYYLTGYEKAYQSALELADCIAYRVRNDAYLCPYYSDGTCSGEGYVFFQDGLYDSNSRPAANSLSILTEAYRATADTHYLEPAGAIVLLLQAEDQPFIHGPNGEDMYTKPWLLNMYLVALGNYLEMQTEFGLEDLYGGRSTLLALADWLHEYAWLPLEPLDGQARAAYPYEWWFDGRQGNAADEWASANNIPSVNNWLLLGADAMAYAYRYSQQPHYLEWGAHLFRTASHDPFYEGDDSLYTETKQTINSIAFGHIFLHEWAHTER